jgi:hypothetical protein
MGSKKQAAKFENVLEASSYLHPNKGAKYAAAREKIIKLATAMGYE